MYDEDQLQDMRFHFSRALEEVRRHIEAFSGDKNDLWGIYDGLNGQLSALSEVVHQIPSESIWNKPYIDAVNDVDGATQQLSYAQGDNDETRPHHLAQTVELVNQAVIALTS